MIIYRIRKKGKRLDANRHKKIDKYAQYLDLLSFDVKISFSKKILNYMIPKEVKNNITPERCVYGTAEIPGRGRTRIISKVNARDCGDGRKSREFSNYEKKETMRNMQIKRVTPEEGAEKNFGGSSAFTVALMETKQDLSVEQAVGLTKSWEESEGRNYSGHDAEHGTGSGCAFLDLASKSEYEELFNVPSDKVRQIRSYMLERVLPEMSMRMGDHDEVGVLEIEGNDKTVESIDHLGNKYFRLDKSYYTSVERFGEYLISQGIDVETNELLENAKKHQEIIKGLVAGGKPIYKLNTNDEIPQFTQAGFVKPIPQRA